MTPRLRGRRTLVVLLVAIPFAARPAAAQQPVLDLAAAIERAVATHPSYAWRQAERERAAASVQEVRATRLPRIATEWFGVRHQEPMIVAPLHGFDPTRPPDFDRALLQGNVGASWLLFDGGARGARIARAESGEDVAEAAIAQAEAALVARVAHAYLAVLNARETRVALAAQLEALGAERDRVARVEAEGRAPRVAVLRAEASSSRARADVVAHEAALAEREAELARLLGLDAQAVAAAALEPVEWTTSLDATNRAALVAEAVAANPDVRRALHQVAMAAATRREARGAYLPSISLGGRYNGYGGAGDFIAEWQAGVHVAWPLFTGGQRTAAVARADADTRAAQSALRLAELDVATQVDRALSTLAGADARVAALEAAVAQFDAVAAVEQLALDAGAGIQTDFLIAQSQLLEARAALSAARHARTAAHIELARATGRLTAAGLAAEIRRTR
jgi:outer membrane protein TolC